MKKILVIAHNEAKAEEGVKLLASLDSALTLKKVYLGAKRVPRHFDAVVVYHTSTAEVNFIKDEIQRYSEAPIKAFLSGKEDVPAYAGALTHKAHAFKLSQASELLQYLQKQREELEGVLQKAFKAFDKDGSGFIDAKELKQMSKEMGRELDTAEIDECMRDLDIDKDNRISFEEFCKWWLSGRQGLSPWMRRLLASKLTAMKLIEQLSAPMIEVLQDATHSDAEDITTHSLTVSINQVDDKAPGIALDAKLLFLSPELTKEHLRVRALHSFPTDADVVLSLAITIPHDAFEGVQAQFEEIKEFVAYMLPDPSIVSLVIEGHLLCIGLNLTMFMRAGNLIERHSAIIKRMQQDLKVDQNVELSIRLATTPKELLTEGAEPFITQLLKGIQVSVRLNVWRKISDVILKMIESGEVDSSMLPIFGSIAPAFLLRLNAKLDLTVDDHMISKLQENPLVAPLLMDAATLVGSLSNVASDDEFEGHLNNLKVPEAVIHMLRVLISQMGDEITLSATHPQLGLQVRLNGEGLGLLVKTITKFLPSKSE